MPKDSSFIGEGFKHLMDIPKKNVLIVDDEFMIRTLLASNLQDIYTVFTAENGQQALDICHKESIDLMVSDINMPALSGFDLIKIVKTQYPSIKTVLITAYDINDYIRLAKDEGISNIIPKSIPFNYDEFKTVIHTLIHEDIFGIERYMENGGTVLQKFSLTCAQDIRPVEDTIIEEISKFGKVTPFINILLEELITNAIYHAPIDQNGNEKYEKHSDITLEKSEFVDIQLVRDTEKYGVSVKDYSGTLTRQKVLYCIDRHINGEGILDENGRGLHMARAYADRFIVNIQKNVATETIFLNYLGNPYQGAKPLYINEI